MECDAPEEPGGLVYIDDHGLRGSNFYWHKYAAHGLTKEDILLAGLCDDRVRVSDRLIRPLTRVNDQALARGWEIYVKEGYRSKKLYEVVYRRRVEKYGLEQTDALFNMRDMPHSSGLSVDVTLWDVSLNQEIAMRRAVDGLDALFSGYYRGKMDSVSRTMQWLQDWLFDIMSQNGFVYGTRREYFHFNFAG